MSHNKRQHFLPQFYLKGFAPKKSLESGNPEIWLYSKELEEVKRKGIKNTAQKPHYYSWLNDEGERDHSKDSELSRLENFVAPIIRKIDRNVMQLIRHQGYESHFGNLEDVNSTEVSELLLFVVSMMTRVPAVIDKMSENVEQGLRYIFGDELYEKDSNLTKKTVVSSALSIGSGLSSENNFHQIFLRREASIAFVPDLNSSLITSDNPVWRWRREGENGIKYDDTELNLPLTQHCQLLLTGKNTGMPLTYFRIPDKQTVTRINKNVAQNATTFIIGRDKLQVRKLAQSLK